MLQPLIDRQESRVQKGLSLRPLDLWIYIRDVLELEGKVGETLSELYLKVHIFCLVHLVYVIIVSKGLRVVV